MADVFISYSDKSPDAAEQIADELERAGISYWLARRSIEPGQSFPQEIQKAIKNCKVFLLILDKNSNQSEHVLNEINLAFRRKNNHEAIEFLVFKTDNSKVSVDIDYFLNRFQHMDGNPPDAQRVSDLIRRIAEILGIEIQNSTKNLDSLPRLYKEWKARCFKGIFIFFSGTSFMGMVLQFARWRIDNDLHRLAFAGIEFYGCLIALFIGIFSRMFAFKEGIACASIPLAFGLYCGYLWRLQECDFWLVILCLIGTVSSVIFGIIYKRYEKWSDKRTYKWFVKWKIGLDDLKGGNDGNGTAQGDE